MRFSTAFVALATPFLATALPIKRAASPAEIAVYKFAEVLEQLETEFYTQALNKFSQQDFVNAGISVPDIAIQNFKDIQSHEATHTAILDTALEALGAQPIRGCTFNFDPVLTDVATMASVARVVEEVGVAAYLGGANLIDDKTLLAPAATILTVEARHQSFLNIINGGTTVSQAFDVALTPQDILAVAGAFVSGCDLVSELGFEELGLPLPAPPLGIDLAGVITTGTQLKFKSDALNATTESTAFCQMLTGTGSNTTALVQPIDNCKVPEDLDGPVWIWLTTDQQPLALNIHDRASDKILAGPTAAFIDSKSSALGALVRTNGAGFSSSETLAPSQTSSLLASATATPDGTTLTVPASAPTSTAATSTAVPAISVVGIGFIPA